MMENKNKKNNNKSLCNLCVFISLLFFLFSLSLCLSRAHKNLQKFNAAHDYCSHKIHRSFDCRYMVKRAWLFFFLRRCRLSKRNTWSSSLIVFFFLLTALIIMDHCAYAYLTSGTRTQLAQQKIEATVLQSKRKWNKWKQNK